MLIYTEFNWKFGIIRKCKNDKIVGNNKSSKKGEI